MRKGPEWFSLIVTGLAAFCVYTCMYAFRKPFTAAAYNGESFLLIDYKIWLVVAQTVGYTLSKFYGIRFIAELGTKSRSGTILLFIVLAWLSLLLFAITPAPYNIIFLLLNGFPLGVIYGLVFSYLEGRRSTELLGAVLATSFIFASGFTQSVGKYVLLNWNVSEWWMPFVTGSLFIIPTLLFTGLLSKTPSPTKEDILLRTERAPMNRVDRKKFIKSFLPGLVLLITTYVMLTIIRDYRSNFASNIWTELGFNDASVFTRSELPASLVTLVLMGLLIFIKKNIYAFLINHLIIVIGFLLCISFTLLYINGFTTPFWWMTFVGVGLYMGYVPFNCMLFDRLIASFKYISNAGFIIYVADSFGYLGSNVILITKNFLKLDISWSDFFVKLVLSMSVLGIILTILSALYFRNKYYGKRIIGQPELNYA
jgi:MFS family permease